MKKLICIILSLVLILLCFAGCSKAPAKLSIDEFIEKYKRANIDTLKSDPIAFLEDLSAVEKTTESDKSYIDPFLSWPSDEDMAQYDNDVTTHKEKEAVLFNSSAKISASVNSDISVFVSVEIESGNPDTDFEVAKAIADALFKKYGDAQEIKITYYDSNEPDLRKMFNGGEKESFTVSFHCPESEWVNLDGEAYDKYMQEKYYSYTLSFHYFSYDDTSSISIY